MSIQRTMPLAAAILFLGGCVTDYTYRSGNGGDYYHGTPRTEYRYYGPDGVYRSYSPYVPYWYGGYGGYWGGYGGYGYGGYGYGAYGPYRHAPHYHDPRYRSPYYGYGHYYGPHGPAGVYVPRTHQPRYNTQPRNRPDGSPWRNLDRYGRRGGNPGTTTPGTTTPPIVAPPVAPPPPPPPPPSISPTRTPGEIGEGREARALERAQGRDE